MPTWTDIISLLDLNAFLTQRGLAVSRLPRRKRFKEHHLVTKGSKHSYSSLIIFKRFPPSPHRKDFPDFRRCSYRIADFPHLCSPGIENDFAQDVELGITQNFTRSAAPSISSLCQRQAVSSTVCRKYAEIRGHRDSSDVAEVLR